MNRPGVEVRYRKGYVAPAGKPAAGRPVNATDGTPPILRDLLSSPMPIPGIRLTATAAPFKGTGKTAAVRIVVQADGRDLTFTKKDGKLESALDLAVVAVDGQSGKDKGGFHFSLALPVTAASQEQVIATGIRATALVNLPPGTYQLRIGAADTVSQRVGSVHYDLEVPDFSAGPLTMSGVVLSSTLAAQTRTAVATPDDFIRQGAAGAAHCLPRVSGRRGVGARH